MRGRSAIPGRDVFAGLVLRKGKRNKDGERSNRLENWDFIIYQGYNLLIWIEKVQILAARLHVSEITCDTTGRCGMFLICCLNFALIPFLSLFEDRGLSYRFVQQVRITSSLATEENDNC